MDTTGVDDDWEPPNEARMKIIEARQERSNRISKLMSEYMLKGYRMLDKLCDECGTILLQKRSGEDYCVTCNELTTETDKDDPAVSQEAAKVAVKEQEQINLLNNDLSNKNAVKKKLPNTSSETNPSSVAQQKKVSLYQNVELNGQGDDRSTMIHNSTFLPASNYPRIPAKPMEKVISYENTHSFNKQVINARYPFGEVENAASVVAEKLAWATHELKSTNSSDSCIQLCNVVKSCSEALIALNNVRKCQFN